MARAEELCKYELAQVGIHLLAITISRGLRSQFLEFRDYGIPSRCAVNVSVQDVESVKVG